jgi:hypothetical protein
MLILSPIKPASGCANEPTAKGQADVRMKMNLYYTPLEQPGAYVWYRTK